MIYKEYVAIMEDARNMKNGQEWLATRPESELRDLKQMAKDLRRHGDWAFIQEATRARVLEQVSIF